MGVGVALIGLDGLPPPVADDWLAGVLGDTYRVGLHSITPPVTAPAWLSMATGLNPGKTGVVDFMNPSGGERRRLTPLTSRSFRGFSVWDYASAAGYRVCVNDYPVLYPPYPVNGYMSPGFLAPRWSTYPPGLYSEAVKGAGPHWEHVYFAAEKRFNDVNSFLDELIRSLARKIKWSLYMLDRRDWGLYVDVVSHTDWLFHRCWHILDEKHPARRLKEFSREAGSSEARYLISHFAGLIESYVKTVKESSERGLIVSDHGFGPLLERVNTARLLEETGLASLRRARALLSPRGLLSRLAWLLTPSRYIEDPFRAGMDPFDTIDYEASAVYTLPHDELMMAVYIAERYRRGAERRAALRRLRDTVDRVNASKGSDLVVVDSWSTYTGPRLAGLPDALILSASSSAYFEFKPFSSWLVKPCCPSRRYTGVHRYKGILAAWGPGVPARRSWDTEASVTDVAPTLLAMLGLPAPGYMDGSVVRPAAGTAKGVVKGRGLLRLRAAYARASARLYMAGGGS